MAEYSGRRGPNDNSGRASSGSAARRPASPSGSGRSQDRDSDNPRSPSRSRNAGGSDSGRGGGAPRTSSRGDYRSSDGGGRTTDRRGAPGRSTSYGSGGYSAGTGTPRGGERSSGSDGGSRSSSARGGYQGRGGDDRSRQSGPYTRDSRGDNGDRSQGRSSRPTSSGGYRGGSDDAGSYRPRTDGAPGRSPERRTDGRSGTGYSGRPRNADRHSDRDERGRSSHSRAGSGDRPHSGGRVANSRDGGRGSERSYGDRDRFRSDASSRDSFDFAPPRRPRSEPGGTRHASRPGNENRPTSELGSRSRRPSREIEIAVPHDADPRLLDPSVRAELRTLSKPNAEIVAGHLVAAGQLVDSDPKRALEHAHAARNRAARVGAVREAVGVAAYHAGEWAEALSELRTARRISGDPRNLALIADCERALGRATQALRVLSDRDVGRLDPETRAELFIVVASARRDLGQIDAALGVLARGGMDRNNPRPGAARTWYVYADILESIGRDDEAAQWFAASAALDPSGLTDAADRAAALL
ncbi:hypothetical protein SAMN05892883_3313 [Jatrophihabitans sp. GAS493]|nr:hypothetical protein SAMN05892883_3313 [Jatrophihabitans sp. GAS493]